eukprot:m.71218 g.71218  ORF g.71218 m.71218 type:complete len:112 (+) comp11701_c0_seq7:284-619(+)
MLEKTRIESCNYPILDCWNLVLTKCCFTVCAYIHICIYTNMHVFQDDKVRALKRYWWLKGQRLHKYANVLVMLSKDDVVKMDIDAFRGAGLTQGASKKITNALAELSTQWQ